MNTLSITCPSCQHTWNIEVPDIPWRALPAYKRVKYTSAFTSAYRRTGRNDNNMTCDRQGCTQEVTATITLQGTTNAEGPDEETYYLCSQHYHDTVHVIKTLQSLVNLPVKMHETMRIDDGRN